MHRRDMKTQKSVTEVLKTVQSYLLVMIYMLTLHVILSHTLGATSSITERPLSFFRMRLKRLRRLLSVSEESVTDASLRSA